ncbi:MAG: 3-phosphoserine/phosphohydroxythreonine transaminase [Flavobacteriaceae bacterium]|nr:3-phosphoserine/phosphohydroxythreonine transaminase [Flavobacteriaceae bacterium]
MKKHNFSAGPCVLPQEVLQKASEAVLNFNQLDLSLIEISHRSKDFVEVMENARALVKKLMNLNDDYEVLFLQGGASLQFIMVPFNLSKAGGNPAYLDTGVWASKAIKESQKLTQTDVVASGKDNGYSSIPKEFNIKDDADYFHCTSNNTIYGTQIKNFPDVHVPLVCDMSSDIFSRELDFSQFDLIYAGAQKNMGPAGATLVVVKKEILGKTGRDIPSYLDYMVHINKESMFNTPPVFPVYVSLLTLQWLESLGGVTAIEKLNNAKAELLYGEIDRNPLFKGFAAVEDRSYMNATFFLNDESLKDKFDGLWKSAGVNGLGGYRTVGGYRASMYNALTIESVQVVVDCMQQLEKES